MSTLVERDQVAKVQDLADEFCLVDRKTTPFMSALAKGSAPVNTLLEYPVEKYAAPQTSGAVDEADPATFEDPSAGDAMLYARVQIFERAARIGGLALTTTHQSGITPRNVVAKKIAKKLIELKRDMETTFLGDGEAQLDNGVVGNKTRGLGKWIQSTQQSLYPVPSDYLTPSASIDSSTALASYTDATITNVFKSSYDQHGNADAELMVWCGSSWKQNLDRITFYSRDESNFTQVRRFNQDAGEPVILGKVDVLETSFGTGIVRCTQFINTGGDPTTAASRRLAYLTPMEFLEGRFSQNPVSLPLARSGRNEKFLVTSTAALACLTPLPFGKWAPGS
jgi:hypothetical protein